MRYAVNLSMRCCECGCIMGDVYNLQMFDKQQDAWITVCLQCWKRAPVMMRSPSFFFPLFYSKRIGRISWLLNPGISHCEFCKTTWQYVPNHTVMMTGSRGVFLFCEKCWKEQPKDMKLQAYAKWWRSEPDRDFPFETLYQAVCADHKKLEEGGDT